MRRERTDADRRVHMRPPRYPKMARTRARQLQGGWAVQGVIAQPFMPTAWPWRERLGHLVARHDLLDRRLRVDHGEFAMSVAGVVVSRTSAAAAAGHYGADGRPNSCRRVQDNCLLREAPGSVGNHQPEEILPTRFMRPPDRWSSLRTETSREVNVESLKGLQRPGQAALLLISADRDAVLEPVRTRSEWCEPILPTIFPVPTASMANTKQSPSDVAAACSFAQVWKPSAERGGCSRSPNRSSSTAKRMNADQLSGSMPRKRTRLPVQSDVIRYSIAL